MANDNINGQSARMSETNPYRKVKDVLGTIGIITLLTTIGAVFVFILVVYPIMGLVSGVVWHTALAPVILFVVIVGILLLVEFVLVPLWKKFVIEPWRAREAAWDRAEWEREDALPLDPEPFEDWDNEGERFATDESGWKRFAPRDGYNPHSGAYARAGITVRFN